MLRIAAKKMHHCEHAVWVRPSLWPKKKVGEVRTHCVSVGEGAKMSTTKRPGPPSTTRLMSKVNVTFDKNVDVFLIKTSTSI